MSWTQWLRLFALVVIPLGFLLGAAELTAALVLRRVFRRVDPAALSGVTAVAVALVVLTVLLAAAVLATYLGIHWVRFVAPHLRRPAF